MNFDTGLLIILFLGILLGGIIFNKRFRTGFFRGLRKFLAGLGSSARSYSAHQRGERRETRRTARPDEPRVKHIYTQTHHLTKCEACDGTGRIKKPVPKLMPSKLAGEEAIECSECKGTGKVYD